MPDLLLELFSEEIPARMQADAARALQGLFGEAMGKVGFPGVGAKTFVTPRRLTLYAENIPASQPDVSTELKGPKVGAPEQAIQGFLKKSGMKLEQLEQRDGMYVAKIHQKGKPTAELLTFLIEGILQNFPWPKSMRWGNGDVTWVRPLHSILCIFDGKVVPSEFGGVKAGNVTYGHRFLAPNAITVKNAADYEKLLEKAHVIADREKRKAHILKQAEKIAAAKNLSMKKDDYLLEEVTGLVEWPVVLAGSIDSGFMDLPKEVLVSEMRTHQKYFALENKDGALSDTFLITANTDKGEKNIIAGNERVLRARFSDARFFWDQDRKKPLAVWAKGLQNVTFHAKLGTIADKVERINALAHVILSEAKDLCKDSSPAAQNDNITRAATLCKADLTTGMVGEFPELQGIMGRYYALAQKEAPEVADAIRDHYKPQGPNDSVPSSPVSVCIALADKLDTLVSMFAIGEKPTGSKDPFALRRAALGVIRIILEKNIRLPLKTCFTAPPARTIAIHKAQEQLTKKTEADLHTTPHHVGRYLTVNESAYADLDDAVPANLAAMLYDFFIDRLIVQLKDSGIRHDVIKAVVANGDDDLVRIVARAKAVQDFLRTDDGKNLLAAYKRAANIVSIEEKKDNKSYTGGFPLAAVRGGEVVFKVSDEENKLGDAYDAITPQLHTSIKEERFIDAMVAAAKLRKPVDAFFANVLINAEDKDLRAKRLQMLSVLRTIFNSIADFSKIEG